MPINSSQVRLLHQKIMAHESIDSLLAEIEQDTLLDTLNYTLSYITRDLSNSDGLSAVHLAAKHGNLPALKSLSRAGANFRLTTDNYGRNALHFAAGFNHPAIIDYLIIEKGIPVDIPTVATSYYSGHKASPLFDCAVHGCIEAAKRLIAHGANVNYEDTDGKNPLSYAENYGHGWCKKEVLAQMDHLLLQHGSTDKSLAAIPRLEEYVNSADSKKEPYIHILESLKKNEITENALRALPFMEEYINKVSDWNKYKAGFKSLVDSLKKGIYDNQSLNQIPKLEKYLKSENYFDKLMISILASLKERALEVATYAKNPVAIPPPVVADKPQAAIIEKEKPPAPDKIMPALAANGLFAPDKPEVRKKVIPDSFFCTLTLEYMVDPVSIGEHTFERSAIENWLEKNRCCPICREPVPADKKLDEILVRNLSLKKVLEEFKELNSELFDNVENLAI